MRHLSSRIILKILLLFFCLPLFSCNQKPAQIVNRSKALYGQNNQISKTKYKNLIKKESFKEKDLPTINKAATPAIKAETSPNKTPEKKPTTNKSSSVEIATGDTLLAISKKYQVTLHDLIKENNLSAPYNLKVGSSLIIPSPNYHEVKAGDTLYSISRLYNMKVNDLIALNDLKEPYAVKLGEKIRVEKFNEKNETTEITSPSPTKEVAISASTESKAKVTSVENVTDKSNRFSWPLKGEIISQFGPKKGGLYNDGINIRVKEGAEVKAAEDGIVAYVGNELKGYGNLIILKHAGGWITAYAHLKNSTVARGQKIKQGEKIAQAGSSGNVSSPQLYFGLRKGRDAVNPERYLR